MTETTADQTLETQCKSLCAACAAGHKPTWQPHSSEWVHLRYTAQSRGTQFAISLCQANAVRKEHMT